MTDITDQDRRDALRWAQLVNAVGKAPLDMGETAARVILATVDAPAPALAEDLRHIAEHWEEWATDTITSAIRAAADRADQTEQERDEARKRATTNLRAVDAVRAQRDEARAEVERLNREQDTERPDDNDWLSGMKEATRYAINATHPNPADVKPVEAWLVEVEGERRHAVKDSDDDEPWNTFTAGGLFFPEDNEAVTPVTRLVPAPRVITNTDELDQAKRWTVIRDAAGVVCSCDNTGGAWTTFYNLANQRPRITLPATVLWEPEA